MSGLSEIERERYSRQLALDGWGEEAQERLRAAEAIVVGAGAIGSPACLYLAAAGVGRIGVVDERRVELATLGAEPLHFTPDLELPKAQNAAVKLSVLNPELHVEPYPVRLDEANAAAIVAAADVVLDCSNDDPTSRALSDACVAARVPVVFGSVRRLHGDVFAMRPPATACRRCAFGEERGAERPTVGALAGVVGSIVALQALELLTELGEPLVGRLLSVDGTTMAQSIVPVEPRPGCPACAGVAAAPQSA